MSNTDVADVIDVADVADVAVVGAGIAGLAVAQALTSEGLRVVVLEARDRVGGRLHGHGEGANGLDLGATWFWPGESRVESLIAANSIATFPQHVAGNAILHSADEARLLQGNPIDVASNRVVGGMPQLANALFNSLPEQTVRFANPVHRIAWMGDRIEVFGATTSVTADHVVIALPPALAMHAIEFTPALPDSLAALARTTPVWMGAVTKVVARYAYPFWRDNGLAGAGFSHVGPIREVHDMSGPDGSPAALFGFVMTQLGAHTVSRAEVVAQLTAMFGPAAAEPIEVIIQDWRNEKYTSPPGVDELTNYRTFGHQAYTTPALSGRLHWASTETAQTNPGHIEGALQAAERASRNILHHYGEDSETTSRSGKERT